MSIKEYVVAEKAVREKQREEYLKDKDYKDFVVWPQGVTEFTLMPIFPRAHQSFGKDKRVFRIEIGGEERDWSVNPLSPMYGDLLDLLLASPVTARLNRMGEGLDTRYSLLP